MKVLLWSCLIALISGSVGCVLPRYTLVMKSTVPPVDESAVSPGLAQKKYHRVMVIPPSGTTRSKFDFEINTFEREFLRGNITAISSAITGRVVLGRTPDSTQGEKVEGASGLSDAERALVMAKETGADAILQIGQLGWEGDRTEGNSNFTADTRFFIVGDQEPAFHEVTKGEFQAWRGKKVHYYGPTLVFVGRLIDVSNGEVMASFNVSCAANGNLPADYQSVWEIDPDGTQYREVEANTDYMSLDWDSVKKKTIERVVQVVAKKIIGDDGHAAPAK